MHTDSLPSRLRRGIVLALTGALLVLGASAGAQPAFAVPDLQVSVSPDRSGSGPLDGETVSGLIYVFTSETETNVKAVKFWLDDPERVGPEYQREGRHPHDLEGTADDNSAHPFDTAALADGTHIVTARIFYSDGSGSVIVNASFTVDNGGGGPDPDPGPDPVPTFEILKSKNPDRSAAIGLAGSVVSASIAVYLDNPDAAEIVSVAWFINDEGMVGDPFSEDAEDPFDLNGGDATMAVLYDTSVLPAGDNLIVAEVTLSDGSVHAVEAVFVVSNAAPTDKVMLFSHLPDRSTPAALNGATVSDEIYPFLDPEDNVKWIGFWLDDPTMEGERFKTERRAPFDLGGTNSDGSAAPFDTTELDDGPHTLTARFRYIDSTTKVVFHTVFIVGNEFSDEALHQKALDAIGGPLSEAPVPGLDPTISDPKIDALTKDFDALARLGKAFFMDIQVGSDSSVACASCHWKAGVDARVINTIAPGPNGAFEAVSGPDEEVMADAYPFHLFSNVHDKDSSVVRSWDDITGSQGVVDRVFDGINTAFAPGLPIDFFVDPGPGLNAFGTDPRQVTGRNTPTNINAVFNLYNFWDGRANWQFNGNTPLGPRGPESDRTIYVNDGAPGSVPAEEIFLVDFSSAASQAVGPPLSDVEMSWFGRSFPDLGVKMLNPLLQPLALQKIEGDTSLFSGFVDGDGMGLDTTYEEMVMAAFDERIWNGGTVFIDGTPYTHMQANFALIWGLAIQAWEQLLVSDQTKFDDMISTGSFDGWTDQEKEGMKLFFDDGACGNCHNGPLFSGATTPTRLQEDGSQNEVVERMHMEEGVAVYDGGFYNIGVRPTEEDLGRGGLDPFDDSWCFSQQLSDRDVVDEFEEGEDKFEVMPGVKVKKGERTACDGAFKVPTLRNVELTGPFMHTGGMGTLTDVVRFYARGATFSNKEDRDPDVGGIGKLRGHDDRIAAVVAFMKTLTDERVRVRAEPFDTPEIPLPNGVTVPATGAGGGDAFEPFLPEPEVSE